MAWLFELCAEFGSDRAAAEAFVKHFDGLTFRLPGDRHCVIEANMDDAWTDREGHYWCRIVPSGASITGRPDRVVKSDAEVTALGYFLYAYLATAPAFRYALIGVESEEFRTFSELLVDSKPDVPYDGVVVSNAIFEHLGEPPGFIAFTSGYWWVPWHGYRS